MPLPARQNNSTAGDYGPTIILEHELGSTRFWTMYGHLSLGSIQNLRVGQKLEADERVAHIGEYPTNGGYPPHVHFQLIADIMDKQGDYPGVAKPSERELWTARCPDPNLILRIAALRQAAVQI